MFRPFVRLCQTAAVAALLVGCAHWPGPPSSTQHAIDEDIGAALNTGATTEQISEAPTAVPNVKYWLPNGVAPLQQY
jgi:hypothetical protein